jgi:hypothetical protein
VYESGRAINAKNIRKLKCNSHLDLIHRMPLVYMYMTLKEWKHHGNHTNTCTNTLPTSSRF